MKLWEIAYDVTIVLIVNTLSDNTTVKMALIALSPIVFIVVLTSLLK